MEKGEQTETVPGAYFIHHVLEVWKCKYGYQ